MSDLNTAREALIVAVMGELSALIQRVEALKPALEQSCDALGRADERLAERLATYEMRMSAVSENAKAKVVQHIAAHAEKAARQSAEQQSQAMAQAARAAFSHALGDTLPHLSRQRDAPRQAGAPASVGVWFLSNVAAAGAGAAATWLLVQRSCA